MISDLATYPALPLIWGNLRNSVHFDAVEVPGEIKIVGTTTGEFPVNSYRPIFLEVPKNNEKSYTVGRGHYSFGTKFKGVNWSRKRIMTLPVYDDFGDASIDDLGRIFRFWESAMVPDEIPCVAIAVKSSGWYCEERLIQSAAVLAIWYDGYGKILGLDWAEGPLEDCITPEWRISSTEILPLDGALAEMERICSRPPHGKDVVFSIYAKPPCLCNGLQGKKAEHPQKTWRHEWTYQKHCDLTKDLGLVLGKIKSIFSIQIQLPN